MRGNAAAYMKINVSAVKIEVFELDLDLGANLDELVGRNTE